MWASTMQQNFGLSGTLAVEQIYMQLETDDAKGGVVFSYPAVLGEFTQLNKVLVETQPTEINEIYRVCKQEKEAVINYAGLDIAYKKERRVTVAFPIMSKIDGEESKSKGAVIWESQLNNTFTETIIP